MPRSKKRGASKSAASKAAAVGEEVLASVEGAPKGKRTRGGASQSPAPQKASPSPAPRSRSRGKAQSKGDSAEIPERVTRAVVQEAEDSPKRGRSTSRRGKQASQPSTPASAKKATPAKAKKTPVRGCRSRSARGKKKVEEDEEMEDEEEDEEEEIEEPVESIPKGRGRGARSTPKKSPAPQKSPAKKKTPAKKASRSRSRGKQGSPAGSQTPLPDAQIVLTKIDSPQKATSPTKSPSPKAAKKTPSPSPKRAARSPTKKTPPSASSGGRSRRGAPVEQEEAEVEDAAIDKVETKEEEEEESVKEPESEEQKEEEVGGGEKEKEEEEKTDAQPEVEAGAMEQEEKPGEDSVEEDEADNENMVDEKERAEDVQPNFIKENGDDAEPSSQKRKFEEVEDEVEEKEEDLSAKKAKLAEELLPQANGSQEENSMESEPSVGVKENIVESEADVDKDYVMVNMNEVPPADSSEILNSIPKEENKEKQILEEVVEKVPIVKQVVEEPVPVMEDKGDVEMKEEAAEVPEEVVEAPIQKEVFIPLENQEAVQEASNIPVPQQEVGQEASSLQQPNPTAETVQSVNQVINEQSAVSVPGEQNWVLNRQFVKNPAFRDEFGDPAKQFSVVSYNILAQCHLERGNYSFTKPELLAADHRYQKLMEELRYLNGDIVCMQEVDTAFYNGILAASMKAMGYEGLWKKRTNELYDEGEATFYKASRFSIVESNTYSLADLANKEMDEGLDPTQREAIQGYLDRPDVMVLVKLRCNSTGQILTVGNIHVHWGQMKLPDVQCIQIASAIKEVVSKAGGDLTPHILCGDFNSEVTSPGYQLCTEGYLSDACIQQLQSLENLQFPDGTKSSLINTVWKAFQHTSSSMKSAYNTAQGKEPKLTSYHTSMKAAVDYVFFSSNCLDNVGVLALPPEGAITQTGGIPNQIFPSDHVSIKAVFSFR